MTVTPTPPSACCIRWARTTRCCSVYGRLEGHALEPDVASSWSASPDGLTYTFKLRKDVKFRDGSPLTSADVRATYDRIINPPDGVLSSRRALYEDITAVETPDPYTVAFRFKAPNAS